jgi:hypothetical protein
VNYQQTWHHLPPTRPNAGADEHARCLLGALLVVAALGTAAVLLLVI